MRRRVARRPNGGPSCRRGVPGFSGDIRRIRWGRYSYLPRIEERRHSCRPSRSDNSRSGRRSARWMRVRIRARGSAADRNVCSTKSPRGHCCNVVPETLGTSPAGEDTGGTGLARCSSFVTRATRRQQRGGQLAAEFLAIAEHREWLKPGRRAAEAHGGERLRDRVDRQLAQAVDHRAIGRPAARAMEKVAERPLRDGRLPAAGWPDDRADCPGFLQVRQLDRESLRELSADRQIKHAGDLPHAKAVVERTVKMETEGTHDNADLVYLIPNSRIPEIRIKSE
jgi:hypothetical protein